MASFRFRTEVPVRFRDLDAVGHVNNAVYATYLEQARIEFVETELREERTDVEFVVASLGIDFHREVPGDADAVTVAVGVREVGDSSFRLGYEIRHDGAVAATGESTQVRVDRESGETRSLPADWRAALAGD